jgi:cysteine sulfinate desulfinase/cysteine desulfurase-like protein
LPNNAHFRFDLIEGEGASLDLDGDGIAVSTEALFLQKH